MEAKLKHALPEYGSQFGDEAIAQVYRARPPY